MSHVKLAMLGLLAAAAFAVHAQQAPPEPAQPAQPAKPAPAAPEPPSSPSTGSATCSGLSFLHPPAISGRLPESVAHLDQAPDDPPGARPYFDNFSWQTFVALAWPADPGDRGQPLSPDDLSVFENPPEGSEPTWTSYRTANELFGTKDPPAWGGAENEGGGPCDASKGKVFLQLTKSGTVFDDLNQAFSFPLIDQNKNYAYYDVQFNQVQYDFIRSRKLYLISKLAAAQPVTMPSSQPGGKPPRADGSIMVKTAWRQMTPKDLELGRYFVVHGQIFVPDQPLKKGADGMIQGTCQPADMGLVGIHLVRKIDGFPQWIWSTFEQVDNIERPAGAPAGTPISFNNGTDTPKTEGGWANRPPLMSPHLQPKDERVPVQVTRYNPIPSTPKGCATPDVTAPYQKELAGTGTVWQYYKLIATQWPSQPKQFKYKLNGGVYPQDCGAAFPANGVVNVSAETYVQAPGDAVGGGGNSCMSCHYGADQSDFSWVLQQRAHS